MKEIYKEKQQKKTKNTIRKKLRLKELSRNKNETKKIGTETEQRNKIRIKMKTDKINRMIRKIIKI
jgi:hypothetical protein